MFGIFAVNILHNFKTNTFHPCYWCESPLPGPVKPLSEDQPLRWKSAGHHTSGFATLAEAEESIRTKLMPQLEIGENQVDFTPMEWDGEIPLTIITPNFLAEKNGKFVAA